MGQIVESHRVQGEVSRIGLAQHIVNRWNPDIREWDSEKEEWPETESNRRHEDFQSSALPTELSGLEFQNASCSTHKLSIRETRF